MKKWSLIIMIIACTSATAQKKHVKENEVPEAIKNNFFAKYDKAKTRTWKTKNGDFEVDFYIGMTKYEAKYEGDGTWKKTSFKINKKEVPEVVINSWKASEFGKWLLDDILMVENIENPKLYLLEVAKGMNIMELLYNPAGDLLKAKNKTEDQ